MRDTPSDKINRRTKRKREAYQREVNNMEQRIKQLQKMVKHKKQQIVEMEY